MTPEQKQMMEEMQALLRSWIDRGGIRVKDVAGLLLGTFASVTEGHYTKEALVSWLGEVLALQDEPETTLPAPKGLPS